MLSIFKKETPIINEPASNIKDLAHDGHNYFSDELILLDEPLSGNLFCAEKVLIEQHGILKGNVTSKTCLVTGQVNGNILSLDLLDIKATAIVRGNIQSAKVNIEPGAVINGYITVGEDIEALTEQWNKTKFSTDQYLNVNSGKEQLAVNKSAVVVQITPDQKPTDQASAVSQETPVVELKPADATTTPPEPKQAPDAEEKPVTKPLAAAAPPKKEEPVNNQRWW
ncbi:bactofilin family protein [Mucilaginibacter panaciglaebae]|uniref:Cytoskeletal protein CcmA (Bactofilin family) n=1 Tax=Mucilaginibacter panaciglaebae TaxID=502331 RepID=A0ABP7WZT7_9SPHI